MIKETYIFYGKKSFIMEVNEKTKSNDQLRLKRNVAKVRFIKEDGRPLENFIYPHQKGHFEFDDISIVNAILARAEEFEELIFLLHKYCKDEYKYTPESVLRKETRDFKNLLVNGSII